MELISVKDHYSDNSIIDKKQDISQGRLHPRDRWRVSSFEPISKQLKPVDLPKRSSEFKAMKVVIVCGSPWCRFESVFSALEAGGVELVKPTERNAAISMSDWHERLFAGRMGPDTQEQVHPGKAWEQAAGDIFLANWDKSLWGWADSRSTWLLDFWRDFDPQIRFVLVSTSPEQALGRAITDASDLPLQPGRVVSAWLTYSREMLRFYNRNRQRCLLIDDGEAHSYPRAFIQTCAETLGVDLKGELLPQDQACSVESSLTILLARELLLSFPEVEELRLEIEASQTRCAPGNGTGEHDDVRIDEPTLEGAFGELKNLVYLAGPTLEQIRTSNATLQEEKAELLEGVDKLESQLRIAEKERDEHARLAANRHEQIEKLKREQDELKQLASEREKQFEADKKRFQEAADQKQERIELEFRQENELLLLQLHQVQEELEHHFLEYQNLKQDLQTMTEARDEQAKLVAERMDQAEVLKHANAALSQAKAELEARQSALEAERVTLAGERDQQANTAAERQAQIEQLTQARDEQTKLAVEIRNQLEVQKQRFQEAADQKQERIELEFRQENELLLLQLHQVQEELEHYFLQYQDLKKDYHGLEDRWNRFLVRHPDYCDWSAIDIVAKDDSETHPMVRWRIKGLHVGNRVMADFELSSVVRDGFPALVVHRTDADNSSAPLLRWPLRAMSQEELIIQPQGTEIDRNERWGMLFGLATTDWRLTVALCSTLIEFLRGSSLPVDTTTYPDPTFWVSQLIALQEQLRKLPPAWRYDQVRLKRQQVNPDYEHLWLSLENVEFGDRCWSEFEFRLSAAMVKPGGFSVHPKLEFPLAEEGMYQLERWYAESHDDFGPKYELRFALDSHAMDLEAWNVLSKNDQLQLISMVCNTGSLLTFLEKSNARISRPWEDWRRLVDGIIGVMRQRIDIGRTTGNQEAPANMEVATTDKQRISTPKASRSRKKQR
jgi:chemotaxis protein histidine kinase CheA